MRQPQWLEDRTIDRHDVPRCRHQGEAQLVLELEEVVRIGHDQIISNGLIISTLIIMSSSDRVPLRTRIREAGGLYRWFNKNLIRLAGPAAVGPYETAPPPTASQRAERACPLCGMPMAAHEIDRTGPKTLMHCP